ncbi:MAG: phosphatase PAP2 family protein [Lachnospiraceae bacterium]|nr:phosphatase PAP2 family protein [Lachnospiraceae bacterium]
MKKFYLKYRHILPVILYMAVYLIWFFHLERTVTSYRIIHTAIDDRIPFIEAFVVPYFMWFGYVVFAVGIAFFSDKEEYYKSLVFLITGMTVFLIISTLWPNGHHLRPAVMPRYNIFTRMISHLYKTDTPTNLWPSIHVYNSIGAHLCVIHAKWSKDKKWLCNISLLLCISIIMSTMFIKQHSFFDVFTALIMSAVMSVVVYRDEVMAFYRAHSKNRALEESIRRLIFK